MRAELLVLLLCLLAPRALALTAEPPLPDPVQEAHAQRLFYEFRCVVCQGQSLAESDAPLAQDIRREIRRRVQAGQPDAQIRDFLVARFGDFILMRPPLMPRTLLLWAGPFLLLITGAGVVWRIFRRGRPA
jgi:cytochrome c-type biogenesis protein CcmH